MNEREAEQHTVTVPAGSAGGRVDVVLSAALSMSRSAVQHLLDAGAVTKAGAAVSKSQRVEEGDAVTVSLPPLRDCEVLPENIPLDIVYEDDDIIVVNKPQGMVVHPAPGHTEGTLVSALLYHAGGSLSDINGVIRPGIVHRIDRDTSGLIAVAKNNAAHQSLAAQLADHSMYRIYSAILRGRVSDEGTVDAPIGRPKKNGGAAGRGTVCRHPLYAGACSRGTHPVPDAAGNRADPSNSGAHGLHRPSCIGRSRLRGRTNPF